jgi:hypothetical protein
LLRWDTQRECPLIGATQPKLIGIPEKSDAKTQYQGLLPGAEPLNLWPPDRPAEPCAMPFLTTFPMYWASNL